MCALLLTGGGEVSRRLGFWIRRYGPAEAACLVTMLVASAAAARLTTSPPLLAGAAIAGATIGFYGVLVTQVAREQRAYDEGRYAGRLATRTLMLLAAEFGAAEVLDTFVWRPALMMAGVVVLGDAVWGLLAGKLAADVLFYLTSALGYRLTEVTGLRHARRRRPRAGISHM